jgi:lipopolysaccharide biosynthesis glycosyltransferase
MAPVVVLLTLTDSHAAHAAVLIHSLVEHARPQRTYRIVLLSPDLSEATRLLLEGMLPKPGNMTLEAFVGEPAAIVNSPFYPPVVMLRFAAGALLQNVDKLVYLDNDTIACRDIGDLFDIDLGGKTLAAADDTGAMQRRSDDAARRAKGDIGHFGVSTWHDYYTRYLGLGESAARGYFNSGVMLIDLKAWRRDLVDQRLAEAAARFGKGLLFPDQDLLNVVLSDDRQSLDARWNGISTRDPDGRFIVAEAPWIIHFAGAHPWVVAGAPYAKLYYQRLAQTPFAGTALVGLSTQVEDLAGQVATLRDDLRSYVLLHPMEALKRIFRRR